MSRLSRKHIRDAFAAGDAASTAAERGRVLEELVAHLFTRFKGVRLIRRNPLMSDRSAEIDIVLWNDRTELTFLPNILLFECKNWAAPVDSQAVSVFAQRAARRHLSYAFLVAANGITGDPADVTAAHAYIHDALVQHDCKIVVLDRAELCGLVSTEALLSLVIEKISRVYLLGV